MPNCACSGYGYAGAQRAPMSVSPHVAANRLTYDRGGIDEWYVNGPLGLEQGFDVHARPAAGWVRCGCRWNSGRI